MAEDHTIEQLVELLNAADQEVMDGRVSVLYASYVRSGLLGGDPSFIPPVASDLSQKILLGLPLTANDRLFLFGVLGRATHGDVAQAIIPAKKRGAPQKGYRAVSIAQRVWWVIRYGSKTSMEGVWEFVAKKENVEVETVRKYWSQHKALILEHVGMMQKVEQSQWPEIAKRALAESKQRARESKVKKATI